MVPLPPKSYMHSSSSIRAIQVMKLLIIQFSPTSLYRSSVQIFSSAPSSQTPSVCVPPLKKGKVDPVIN
jgi:hypothetical protein